MIPAKTKHVRKRKAYAQNDEMSLNITALADVFVILLVFLLKSYASGLDVTPGQGVQLANAKNTTEGAVPGLKIEISKDGVYLEGVKAVGLEESVDGKVRAPASTQPFFPELQKGLSEARSKREWLKNQGAAVPNEKEVLIVSDKGVPYSVVKKVLITATMEGFSDAKLAVIRE